MLGSDAGVNLHFHCSSVLPRRDSALRHCFDHCCRRSPWCPIISTGVWLCYGSTRSATTRLPANKRSGASRATIILTICDELIKAGPDHRDSQAPRIITVEESSATPDGLILLGFVDGLLLTWDATVVHTYAREPKSVAHRRPSYLKVALI